MSAYARIVLVGGPYDGEEAFQVPPDTGVPIQIVWAGWFPWGFDAWLYQWNGERFDDFDDQTHNLVYRMTGRRLAPDEIPPAMAAAADTYADAADLLARIQPLHPALRLP